MSDLCNDGVMRLDRGAWKVGAKKHPTSVMYWLAPAINSSTGTRGLRRYLVYLGGVERTV
jgi:hypothetical protein